MMLSVWHYSLYCAEVPLRNCSVTHSLCANTQLESNSTDINNTHLRTRIKASSKGRKYGVAISDTALYAFVLYKRAMKPRFTLSHAACNAAHTKLLAL